MTGLYGLLHESAANYPRRIFVKDVERTWTYREVNSAVEKASESLLERGIQKGDRVVVLCNNSIKYIVAFFSILRINAVAVPVNPGKMRESILYIIDKSTPKLILTSDETVEKLKGQENMSDANILNIETIMDRQQAEESDGYEAADAKANDVAVILFTSGTTANPKGVTLTHANLIENTKAIIEYLKLTCDDSILITLPFTYSYGNSVLLTHACVGGTVIIENVSAFPYKILEEIKKNRVSGFSTVGSYMNIILKCIKGLEADQGFFDRLRYLTLAGEAVNNDDVVFFKQNYPDIKLYVMYGQTEASARLSYLDPDLLDSKLGSVGKGLCNVTLRVVNEEGGDVGPGETGEIIAQGPSIMKGYWEDPYSTGKAVRNGWLYTGDNATVDEEGYIYIQGRKTDIIKHMGYRISPVEIESAINSCENVKESAAIESIRDGVAIIKAFVVLGNECPMDELKRAVSSRLPFCMRPQEYVIVESLPRTESGKIKRSVLRSLECAE